MDPCAVTVNGATLEAIATSVILGHVPRFIR